MARKDLENLLDSMLEDSDNQRAVDAATEAEERQKEAAAKKAAQTRALAAEGTEAPVFTQIETLTGLTDGDFKKVLGKAAPDDLLVLLATASDAMQRRMLLSLTSDSVRWLRENLAHIEEVTNAEKEGAERKILKAANQLLAKKEIVMPSPETVGGDEAPSGDDRDLRELLSELVRIASSAGADALSEVVAQTEEPLLTAGLGLVVNGEKGKGLKLALRDQRAKLEMEYAKRLLWIEDAIVAIAEGEDPKAFRAKLFPKKP
jgi:hypothetical protein